MSPESVIMEEGEDDGDDDDDDVVMVDVTRVFVPGAFFIFFLLSRQFFRCIVMSCVVSVVGEKNWLATRQDDS